MPTPIHIAHPAPRTVGDAIADLAVPTAPFLDAPVAALPTESAYARWIRGEISVEDLLGDFAPVLLPQVCSG
jgi:hypothetical protein